MQRCPVILGYGSGIGSRQGKAGSGPEFIRQRFPQSHWEKVITHEHGVDQLRKLAALPVIQQMCDELANCTEAAINANKFPIVIGGDHSCAIGTWSGVSSALKDKGSLGLIWVDAHMDSHVIETSPSCAIHGMPLAVLLGKGSDVLTQVKSPLPKVLPEHLCLIGVRDYEPEEKALLDSMNVRIYYMDEIKERSLEVVLNEAREHVSQGTVGYGLSIDVDGFDAEDAPGVSTAVRNGIRKSDFMQCIAQFVNDQRLVGLEIAEFAPSLDVDDKTYSIVADILTEFLDY